MSVLVLSDECDPTADAVVVALQARGQQVHRADLGWFPTALHLDAQLGPSGWTGSLRTGSRDIGLAELRSVFYRSPTAFRFPAELSGPELRHAHTEAKMALAGCLWSLPDLLWLNHPGRQADMYKPAQLAAARAVGLSVPRSLITNKPEAVKRFAAAVDEPIVVKPLGYSSIVQDGGRRALYTHVLTPPELADLRGVATTAHLFQQYIADKAYELRLTVVGSGPDARLFPAAIRADSPTGAVDFRADYDALSYTVAEVPVEVDAGVRALMRHFGIQLGHFDFSVDRGGRHFFLECNGSGGQYQFIEQFTGLAITEAIVDLLQKGRT